MLEITIPVVLKVGEICSQCEKSRKLSSSLYCLKFGTDSVVFKTEKCDKIKEVINE